MARYVVHTSQAWMTGSMLCVVQASQGLLGQAHCRPCKLCLVGCSKLNPFFAGASLGSAGLEQSVVSVRTASAVAAAMVKLVRL